MIILDTNTLVQLVVVDQASDDAHRLKGLLETAKRDGMVIGIPTPVFAEFLVRADDATTELLVALDRKAAVRILPFDKKSAHECALLDQAAYARGGKKAESKQPWQRVKIDRQIIAIARANGATQIITSDKDLIAHSNRYGLEIRRVGDLPIPDSAKQQALDLKPAAT